MKTKIAFPWQLLCFFFLLHLFSDTSATIFVWQEDYIIEIPNADLTFVMLAPGDFISSSKIPAIREKYKESGFYEFGNPLHLIQSIDWYAAEHEIHITSNGQYLIRDGGPPQYHQGHGVSFYENGVLIKSYLKSDLVKLDLFLTYPLDHLSYGIKESQQEFYINDGIKEVFVFDISTGELKSGRLVGVRNKILTIVWLITFFTIFIGLPLYGLYRLVKWLFFYLRRPETSS